MTERGPDQRNEPDETPNESAESEQTEETEGASAETDYLANILEETSIWPILLVVLFSTGTFGAGMIVLAIGDRNPFAAAALLLVAGMTIDVLVRARCRTELRTIAKFIILFWVVSSSLALIALISGIA